MGPDTLAYGCLWGVVVGLLVVVAGYLWHFVNAFAHGIWWGLGCILLPGFSLVFVGEHWRTAWKPAAVIFFGVFIAVLAFTGLRFV